MTIQEWSQLMKKELEGAGFTVEVIEEFCMIREPLTFDQRKKLLEFRVAGISFGLRIYRDGVMFVPE